MIQVNNNGLISFDGPVRTFTSEPFPLSDSRDFIAPYWADVDTRGGRGRVYYRDASTEQDVVMRARNEIRMAFVGQASFQPNLVFIATWERVGFVGGGSSPLVNHMCCSCMWVVSQRCEMLNSWLWPV